MRAGGKAIRWPEGSRHGTARDRGDSAREIGFHLLPFRWRKNVAMGDKRPRTTAANHQCEFVEALSDTALLC
jgi:hypothetical protein